MGALDDLREAAELLRVRAESATRGPWISALDGLVWAERLGDPVSGSEQLDDAAYIALVHPGVGLALAGLLDKAAAAWPLDITHEPPRDPRDRAVLYEALAVARIILGRADG